VPSRQDQLHSYQYSLQRVVAALVTHDPDPSRSPLRRAGTTAMVSLLIACLAVGAAAIYGFFTGHSTVNPKDPEVVFQEKGSGARYVFLASDAKLHPVLNYTSGLLLAASEAPELKSITAEKLASVPLGPALGIPDAPDSLPVKDALLTDRWSICTDQGDGGEAPHSTLLVGDKLTDGTVAAKEGKALLVQQPGRTSMLFNNRLYPIPGDRLVATLRVLRWDNQDPWPVSEAWANQIPLGPNLTAPGIADVGTDSLAEGLKVGEVVTDSGKGFSVVLSDGVAPITDLQAMLIQAATEQPPRQVGGAYIGLRSSKHKVTDANDADGLPGVVPDLITGKPEQVCMTLPVDPKSGDGIRIGPTVPAALPVTGGGQSTPGHNVVDYVHVPRGHGVLAAATASPSAPASTGTVSIITDTGYSYQLADRSLITKLGYQGKAVQQVPSALISMLPAGPSLDPQRARQAEVP
jgi:type VII secretion protein EccB